jgi:acylphosphatase
MQKMSPPNENYFQFENLLVKLAGSGVDFAVVGGVAISLNGFVRATDDVDILVEKSAHNLRKLLDCLAEWGQGFARELKVEDFADVPGAVRVMENFDLDIFLQMREKTLEDFRPNLRFFESGVVRIAYLSPADLIFLKDGSRREKDQLDVSAMKEILAREAKQK